METISSSPTRPAKRCADALPARPPVSLRPILLDSALLLTIVLVTLLLQLASGAHSAAFGAEPDEASHYVTGVMVRDYIARGLPGNPITFAKDFYVHYPRVAFGLWPPLFHLLSGVWMLAFGTGRMSVMFMLCALTGMWAFIFYRIGRPVIGTNRAAISAFLLVLLPITQRSTSAVMVDIPLAIMMLLAMVAYARYLEREKTADALMFGLWAAAALLVKYNAFSLALLPPVCVVITGRHYLWRRRGFWLPAAVVLVVAGPWYVLMSRLALYAADPGGGLSPFGLSLVASAKGLVFVAGPLIFVLCLLGSVLVFLNVGGRRQVVTGKTWALYVVASAMVLSVSLFHVIYPLFEPRYLLPTIPSLLLMSWPAIDYLRSLLRRPVLVVAALLFVAAAHFASTFALPAKKTSAYVGAAEAVLASGLSHNGAVLVSANAVGEGMLTAEFVMRDHRPDHYVVRASKVLATQTLMGDKYRLKYHSPEEIMTALDSIPIEIVVIQKCARGECGEHEDLLNEAASRYPERWQLSSVIPSETGSPIRIYQITGNEGKAVQKLSIDMTNTLGTTVEK